MFNGIDRKEIQSLELTNKLEPNILTIYDRYEIRIHLKTGEEKTITLYTDKGTVPEKIPDEYKGQEKEFKSKIKEFFFKTLFQRNKSESEIYLGSFNYKDNSKPVNDIYSNAKSGVVKQALFDNLRECLELYDSGEITYEEFMDEFPELAENQDLKENENPRKDSVKAFRDSLNPDNDNYDKETEPPKIGKHYVLGDIHGYKEPYDKAFQMIKPEDSLVLLGDVVDRGPNGIDMLQDLIRRKANTPESNITFILGNHENMMFTSINYILRLNLSHETISNIIDYFNASCRQERIYENYNETGSGDIELAEALGRECAIIKKNIEKAVLDPKVNVDRMIESIGTWCHSKNGGNKTLQAFMNLDKDEQKNIFEFLRTSYIMKQQKVQGKDILFVHSRPPKDINLVKGLKQSKDGGMRASEIPPDEFDFVVWNREIDTYSQCKELGLKTICGHEYEDNTSIVDRQKGYVRIDEGCGHGGRFSVGLYCIEDDTITHIGQDSKTFETYGTGKIKIIDERGREETIKGTKIPQERTL